MSGYDDWLTRVPDPFRYDERQDEEPPCLECGALSTEPCELTCQCPTCRKQRDRFGVADPEAV